MSSAQEPPALDNYYAVVSAFRDFLTVAVHTILYERDIYPRTSFLKARKYNYPVRQSRHPKVCKWVQDAVAAVEAEMLKVCMMNVHYKAYMAGFSSEESKVTFPRKANGGLNCRERGGCIMLCSSDLYPLFPFCETFVISEYLLPPDTESLDLKVLELWAQRLAAKKDCGNKRRSSSVLHVSMKSNE